MITKDNNYKVMKIFFTYPEKSFHIRELARLVNLSSAGVIKIVKRLKKEGLLTSKKIKMVEEVSIKGEKFYILKKSYNLFSLYDSGFVSFLKDFYEEPEAIVVFGSYADGTDNSKSDIDVAIITKKEDVPNIIKFEKKLKRRINLISISKVTQKFKNALANGIVLNGYLKI